MICNRCKVDKPETEFIHGKLKCRECYKKCRAYYQAHREQEIARAQKSNQKKDRDLENKRKRQACRKNPNAYMLWNVKSRAKVRGIPFNLVHEDIVIPKLCPILGIPLEISTGGPSPNSPSLDRIDPQYGYVKGNVHVISHRANTIKSDATLEELKMLVHYLENNCNTKPSETTPFDKISRHANHPIKDQMILEFDLEKPKGS